MEYFKNIYPVLFGNQIQSEGTNEAICYLVDLELQRYAYNCTDVEKAGQYIVEYLEGMIGGIISMNYNIIRLLFGIDAPSILERNDVTLGTKVNTETHKISLWLNYGEEGAIYSLDNRSKYSREFDENEEFSRYMNLPIIEKQGSDETSYMLSAARYTKQEGVDTGLLIKNKSGDSNMSLTMFRASHLDLFPRNENQVDEEIVNIQEKADRLASKILVCVPFSANKFLTGNKYIDALAYADKYFEN
jgi:hypothetical protein